MNLRQRMISSAITGLAQASVAQPNPPEPIDLRRDRSRKGFHGAGSVEAIDAAALRDHVLRVDHENLGGVTPRAAAEIA